MRRQLRIWHAMPPPVLGLRRSSSDASTAGLPVSLNGPPNSVITAARRAVLQVVERLAASGAVDDRTFAESRARRLMRSGHSSRAIAAHLAVRGIDPATRKAALTVEPDQELAAAVKMTARKRIGPFRSGPADETTHRRELGILARAGFDQETARHALGLDHDAAEEVLRRFRQE